MFEIYYAKSNYLYLASPGSKGFAAAEAGLAVKCNFAPLHKARVVLTVSDVFGPIRQRSYRIE